MMTPLSLKQTPAPVVAERHEKKTRTESPTWPPRHPGVSTSHHIVEQVPPARRRLPPRVPVLIVPHRRPIGVLTSRRRGRSEVRTRFRCRERTLTGTFLSLGKSAKPPVKASSATPCRCVDEALEAVSGESLEDLHDTELECQRVRLHRTLLNSVPQRNVEDLPDQPKNRAHEELECPRSAPTPILSREKTLRTSRSVNDLLLEQKGKRHEFRHFHCSVVCVLRKTLRERRDEDEILGTSITCSGIGKSRCQHASTSWSPPCGPGMSRITTMGTTSASCSTVRCWTLSCGPHDPNKVTEGGQEPPGSSSKTGSAPAGEEESSGPRPCSATRSPTPRPCPSCDAEGLTCVATWPGPHRSTAALVATTSAVVRRGAAPVTGCQPRSIVKGDANKRMGALGLLLLWWLWFGPSVSRECVSIPAHGCNASWGPCPCGHDPTALCLRTGPQKDNPTSHSV